MEDIIDIIVTETTNTIEITAQPNDEIIDVNIIDNREDIVLNVTPSIVEININSLTGNFGVNWGQITGTLSNQTDLQTVLNAKADLVGGIVPSSQLPSFVDDVIEVATFAALPVTGEQGKIYVVIATNLIYRWSGSAYIEIKDSSAVWGAITGTLSSQNDLQTALDAKQDDLNGTGFVKAIGTTISYDNTTYQPLLTNPITGSGTANYHSKFTGANTLGNSLIYDDGSNVTINGTTGTALFNVQGSKTASSAIARGQLLNTTLVASANSDVLVGLDVNPVYTNGAFTGVSNISLRVSSASFEVAQFLRVGTGSSRITVGNTAGTITTIMDANSTTGAAFGSATNTDVSYVVAQVARLKIINTTGNVILQNGGTFTDAGYRLDVQGTARVSSNLTASSFIKSGGTSAQFLKADGSVDSSTYALDSAVVKLTGTQTVAGVKTFSNQPVFNDTIMQKNTASGTVLFGGYTTLWTTDSAFTALVGTATSTTIGFSLLYDTSGQRSYTMPTSNGTLALTSQLSAYLPLGGGTMTGVLFGASASFSGFVGFGGNTSPLAAVDVTGAGIFSSSVRSSGYYLTGMTAGSGALYYNSGANRVTVANYNASGIVSFEVNGGSTALTLNSNLSATFTSTLSATGATLTGALSGTSATFSGLVTINRDVVVISGSPSVSTNSTQINLTSSGANLSLGIDNSTGTFMLASGGQAYGSIISTNNATPLILGTNLNARLTIASTGAATFSSSVTATSALLNGTAVSVLEDGIRVNRDPSTASSAIFNANGGAANIISNSGTTSSFSPITFKLSDNTTTNEAMRITGSGNVGIGTTSPDSQLVINGSSNSRFNMRAGDTRYGTLYADAGVFAIASITSIPLVLGTNDIERMRITSGGTVCIGNTTGAGDKLAITQSGANWAQTINHTNATQFFIEFRSSGTAIGSIIGNGTTTAYNVTSDYRLKQDLKPINGLEIVNKIKVYDYQWKYDKTRMDGVLAHELAEVLPYAVIGVKDGEQMQQVDYSKIVPVMVQAIKDLKKELDTLKNK